MQQTAFKSIDCLHFINCKFVSSLDGKTFENINPATEAVLGKVVEGGGG